MNGNRTLERLHGLFGVVLLRHLERDGKGNDEKNDGAARKITDGARDDGRDDKNGDERINQAAKNFRADVAPRRLGDHVVAGVLQAVPGLVPAQSFSGRAEFRQEFSCVRAPERIVRI